MSIEIAPDKGVVFTSKRKKFKEIVELREQNSKLKTIVDTGIEDVYFNGQDFFQVYLFEKETYDHDNLSCTLNVLKDLRKTIRNTVKWYQKGSIVFTLSFNESYDDWSFNISIPVLEQFGKQISEVIKNNE